jgi:ABC-type polysaccharide/polyol phosphate transport system ATPase subunit
MATDERTPALLPDNVVKTYDAIRAVDGVSLDAFTGEFIALLGPNGAGKTTLFQLLSGLFMPDSGRIEIMGQDMLAQSGTGFGNAWQVHRPISRYFRVLIDSSPTRYWLPKTLRPNFQGSVMRYSPPRLKRKSGMPVK